MSAQIKILSDQVVNKIAAGEVVERPASVVKELVENSIDAGATEVMVDIERAGRRLIRVTDNGAGMSEDDAHIAFTRHATSKITTDADLDAVLTMGFRGEALSSVASVSHARLLTAERGASSGTVIELEGGKIKAAAVAATPQGTSLEISHLFYNTPARLKFLKSPATEFSHILTVLSRLAMANPSIRFRLTHEKKVILDLPSSATLGERVFQLYGEEIANNLIAFKGGEDPALVHGLLGRPGYTRSDKTYQDFYVNRRAVRNASLTHALYGAYGDMLMRDRHPLGFIFIEIDPALVDVNVHPAKAEVRFRNQSQIHDLVRDVIREGLRREGLRPARALSNSDGTAEGVKESLADYFSVRNPPGGTPGHSSFFNRRKSDLAGAPQTQRNEEISPEKSTAARQEQIRTEPLHDLFPLAQIHASFIIAQSQEGMALIDQHAAHERVLFEKLQDQCAMGRVAVQHLLIPEQVQLGPAQGALLSEHLTELARLGLHVEDFGGGTFIIKAIPSLLGVADYKKLLLDILDEIGAQGASETINRLRDEVLGVMACHPAVKMHRKLDMREMEQLLHDLFECRMPHTCPHGRPTVIRFTMDEIKKMFKRI